MSQLQQYLSQFDNIKNVAIVPGQPEPRHAKHLLFAPTGTQLTVAQIAAILATLQANVVLDDKTLRWFPFNNIADIAVQTPDPIGEDIALVGKVTVRSGFPEFVYRFRVGGYYGHILRRSFNKMHDQYDAFIIDADDVLWGEEQLDSNGAPVLGGYSLANIFSYSKSSDGKNEEQYYTAIGFSDPRQFENSRWGIKLGFNFGKQVTGLRELKLVFDTQSAALTYKFRLFAGNGTTDLYASVASILAANTSLCKFTEAKTGLPVGITSITTNGVGITVVLSNASNYPAVGENFAFTLDVPSALKALGITPYEANKSLFKRTT